MQEPIKKVQLKGECAHTDYIHHNLCSLMRRGGEWERENKEKTGPSEHLFFCSVLAFTLLIHLYRDDFFLNFRLAHLRRDDRCLIYPLDRPALGWLAFHLPLMRPYRDYPCVQSCKASIEMGCGLRGLHLLRNGKNHRTTQIKKRHVKDVWPPVIVEQKPEYRATSKESNVFKPQGARD